MSRATRPKTISITRRAPDHGHRQEAYYRVDWRRFRKGDRTALALCTRSITTQEQSQ